MSSNIYLHWKQAPTVKVRHIEKAATWELAIDCGADHVGIFLPTRESVAEFVAAVAEANVMHEVLA